MVLHHIRTHTDVIDLQVSGWNASEFVAVCAHTTIQMLMVFESADIVHTRSWLACVLSLSHAHTII